MNPELQVIVTKLIPSNLSIKRVSGVLRDLDNDYAPALSTIVDIDLYAEKLVSRAVVLLATIEGKDVGLVAIYVNDQINCIGYISTIGARQDVRGKGIGRALMESALNVAKSHGMYCVRLEVSCVNTPALSLYRKMGFSVLENEKTRRYDDSILMYKSVRVG